MKKADILDIARYHYDADELASIETAIDFAKQAHKGQKRASGEPYIRHCYAVAATLMEWELDSKTVIAGILHDTLEDTAVTPEELEKAFGHEITFLVEGVTKMSAARSGMKDISTYLPSTKDNLSKLLIAVSADMRVLLIKLADRLHNLQTLQYLPEEKRQKIARESLEVFAPLADRLGIGKLRVQIEELSFEHLDPKEYHRLQREIKKRLGRSHKNLISVRREIAKAMQAADIPYTVDGRIKSTYSLYKKLRKNEGNIDGVYDLMALRIIVDTKEQCYQVLGILHSLYTPLLNKMKDYIAVPKQNGYQSLHTTVITPSEQIVEFQIRTKEMHVTAERGLAAAFHYNEQKLTKNYARGVSSAPPRNLLWISQLQELTDKIQDGHGISEGELTVSLFADRIFVYSPKGDIYDLPEGAYPLDFAFAVHSDIALHAQGFKVNGRICPFDRQLHNGDIIEVVTRRNCSPKSDWLEYCVTHKAKQKLKAALKK